MARHPSHLLQLARRGAEVRFRELAHEMRHLLAVFPHLSDTFDPDQLPVGYLIAEGARESGTPTPSGRRGRSASARRAHSARMKKIWAARRKASNKT